MNERTVRLDVLSMTCANCATTVRSAVEELDGVRAASVNVATDEGSVTYDPERVSLAEVYDAVEAAGYEAVTE